MCGIVGFNWDDKNLVQSMNNSQIHRGPDSGGLYIDKSVSLGSRRLSIIDISSKGNQPMKTDCGEFIIVYNGEIYNYKEIRKDLELRGHIFRSGTDTEVLLLSYKEWGDKCLSRLIGMFSFCIYDKSSQVLFLARDRFGIKPLYYYILGNKFVFSSWFKWLRKYRIFTRAFL